MDYTTAKTRYIPWTPLHTPLANHSPSTPPPIAQQHMSALRVHVAHPDTIRSPSVNKSNLNFGSYASSHLGSHNLMSSQETQQAYPRNLIITHFVLSTLRRKHKFDAKPPNVLQPIPRNVNVGFTWTTASCGPPHKTSLRLRDRKTVSFTHMMVTHHICSLWTKPHATSGSSPRLAKTHLWTLSQRFYGYTATSTVAQSEQTKAGNSHVATPSRTCCFGTTVTYSNLQGLTVPPRTVWWKYIMTNLGSGREHSCTDLASRQSTGPLPFATQYTFTIGWSITKLKSHHSKDTTECARIYHDLKYLALAFVLNGPVTAPENSITICS
jgi:hypothetical protein